MPNNIFGEWARLGQVFHEVPPPRRPQIIYDDLVDALVVDDAQQWGGFVPDIVEGVEEPYPTNPEVLLESFHLKLHGSRFFLKKAEDADEQWPGLRDLVMGNQFYKPSDWDFYADEQDIQIGKIIHNLGFSRVDEHYGGAGHDLLTVAVYKSIHMPNCQIVLKRHSEIYDQWLKETSLARYIGQFWKRMGHSNAKIQDRLNQDILKIADEKGIVL